jgi:L-threonylcarbamoyladenylate synthase
VAAADVEAAIAALRGGDAVVIPTDTVYGLAGTADTPAGRDAVYAIKGRDEQQPSALVCASVDALLERLPELREHEARVRALLPGPYTLLVRNPEERFPWLCGSDPTTLGVRVPDVTGPAAEVLSAAGAVVATSANLPGGPEPGSLDDVPQALLDGVAAVVDGGVLPGVPSTVLDVRGTRFRVLREGAGSVSGARERLAAVDS